MRRSDIVAGGLFLALGIALLATGAAFPSGVGGLPGAGFFPQIIGGVTALLAGALVVNSRAGSAGSPAEIENIRHVAGALGLLCLYLLLWGTGFFVIRTAVFLLLLLTFLGQRWISAAVCSTVLTVFAYLAFDMGLNVSLE